MYGPERNLEIIQQLSCWIYLRIKKGLSYKICIYHSYVYMHTYLTCILCVCVCVYIYIYRYIYIYISIYIYIYIFSVRSHNFWSFNDVLGKMLPSQTSVLCSGNEISSAFMKHSWNHQSLVLIWLY